MSLDNRGTTVYDPLRNLALLKATIVALLLA